ncbi:oxacillin-hydrolyzing class D beta-lactamase OXA-50 [Cupriavidus sp. TA19]|uniref:OXA-1206 family carbapenem-hydrolyzing class D beta-lactamase n=1 Tax=unclassified Cupriavidus TaxID=2640874 RepID=UPI0027294912|nr:penicillin-binding transpeptidase domain-containing protein [Cupriavidus sp. TA19]GLC91627.1 oxacillin-hydrolyzing class D beta-lactamase OXA-50 [Cupriavidus sp. TA19]
MPIRIARLLSPLAVGFALLAATLPAAARQDATLDAAALFRQAGTTGTIVIHDLRRDRVLTYNAARAATQYSPASTFKIMNSLIGLDSGAVADTGHDKLPWDGKVWLVGGKAILPEACNADVPLSVAFPNSCVPAYQALARRVGSAAYQRYLSASHYGNADSSGPVDRFWLNGRLQISAYQQIDFLKGLVQRTLPFSPAAFDGVDRLTVIERTTGYTLHGKTGWADSTQPAVGWLVGWVERGGDNYLFALNLDMLKPEHAKARMEIVRAALRQVGALPD